MKYIPLIVALRLAYRFASLNRRA